jgi:hypothetical protein
VWRPGGIVRIGRRLYGRLDWSFGFGLGLYGWLRLRIGGLSRLAGHRLRFRRKLKIEIGFAGGFRDRFFNICGGRSQQ